MVEAKNILAPREENVEFTFQICNNGKCFEVDAYCLLVCCYVVYYT